MMANLIAELYAIFSNDCLLVCYKFMDLAEKMRVEWWDSICFSKCPDADVGLSTHVRRFLG